MAVKLFSPEWCEGAQEACNNSKAMYAGFKDPETFTNRMAFGVKGRPDLTTHLEWEKAKITYWGPPKFDEGDLWLVIHAKDIETWRKCAEEDVLGQKLLLAGKITFEKGPMSAAIDIAGAFNNFLSSWGEVDTDWDV